MTDQDDGSVHGFLSLFTSYSYRNYAAITPHIYKLGPESRGVHEWYQGSFGINNGNKGIICLKSTAT